MIKRLFFTLVICLIAFWTSPGQINLQQITTSDIGNDLLQQKINPGQTNVVTITQLGNQNMTSIKQNNNGILMKSNLATVNQQGDWNSLNISQNGSGNNLLSYQLSYIANSLCFSGNSFESMINSYLSNFNVGQQAESRDGNTLSSSQEGTNNQLLAIQLGTNNLISTEQKGQYNYLNILQQGTNIQLTDYKQFNNSGNILCDAISQIGNNLDLNVTNAAENRLFGNSYTQQGENLSLTINSSLLNTQGGLKVQQTGHDMQIEINQSYFAFPMK